MPGFGKKVMIDTAKIDQFIKEVTDLVPQDIQEAKEIINQKNSILAQANMEAQRIIESANRDSDDISSKSQVEFEKLVVLAVPSDKSFIDVLVWTYVLRSVTAT